MKSFNTFFKRYLLFSVLGIMAFSSCEKDYGKSEEQTKELSATVSADKTVANGASLEFIDVSLGVKTRTWTFPGGIPATSGKPVVQVVFTEEGDVSAKLEIEYFDGSKETKNFAIKVFPVLIANFTPSAIKIKVGESVTFTDKSIGGATTWLWEFEGGTPATSTAQNPTVKFDLNKAVKISLKIKRAADASEAIVVKDALVQVGPVELMYNGSFEDGKITDFQTWNGAGFPLLLGENGANGTKYCAYFDYDNWGGAELMSRDKPADKMIKLENGKSYTVSMYLKAEVAGALKIGWFQLANNPLSPWDYSSVWGTNEQVLTTEWQLVSFVANIPDDNKERINNYHNFWLTKVDGGANVTTKVYMDELSIKIVE
ncbi:MAG TPA: hypothetical protein DCQ31_13480 [Bacteroidales bacterium]|nr:hypothetical protein [Bacteroidales bacterium]